MVLSLVALQGWLFYEVEAPFDLINLFKFLLSTQCLKVNIVASVLKYFAVSVTFGNIAVKTLDATLYLR